MKFRKKKIKSVRCCMCQHSCKHLIFHLAAATSSPDIVLGPDCRETCLRWGHPEFSSSCLCRGFRDKDRLQDVFWSSQPGSDLGTDERHNRTNSTVLMYLLDCRTDPVWISTLVLIYGGPGFFRTQFCGEDEFEILTSPGPADIFWSAGQTSGPDFFFKQIKI